MTFFLVTVGPAFVVLVATVILLLQDDLDQQ